MNRSIFYDEWRECLRAHYMYVVETKDHVTQPTLCQVLLNAGISEPEIESWFHESLVEKTPPSKPQNLSLFDL